MIIKPMAEIDCNKLCTVQGLTTPAVTCKFKNSVYTRAIHANDNLSLMVVDKYGNASKKEVLKGITYVGEYIYIYDISSTASLVAADKLTIIF